MALLEEVLEVDMEVVVGKEVELVVDVSVLEELMEHMLTLEEEEVEVLGQMRDSEEVMAVLEEELGLVEERMEKGWLLGLEERLVLEEGTPLLAREVLLERGLGLEVELELELE